MDVNFTYASDKIVITLNYMSELTNKSVTELRTDLNDIKNTVNALKDSISNLEEKYCTYFDNQMKKQEELEHQKQKNAERFSTLPVFWYNCEVRSKRDDRMLPKPIFRTQKKIDITKMFGKYYYGMAPAPNDHYVMFKEFFTASLRMPFALIRNIFFLSLNI